MGRTLAIAIVLATLAVAAPARAADHAVSFPTDVYGAPYSPSQLQIATGDTVTFSGAFEHHPLVWDKGEFPTQADGTSKQFAFPAAGTYAFHCMIHSTTMTGSVTVASPDGGGTTPPPGGGGTTPPGGPGGGDGTGPGADVTAPTVRLAPAVALRFRGDTARLRVTADEPGRAVATLRSRGRVLARGEGSLRASAVALKVRLTKRGVARLRRARRVGARLTLLVTDAAGNRRTVTRALTLRR